ncbi:MAG: hypothetical protein IJW40_01260 [Clostridia bacterium]|nr:hypothetical protein [Clostridia bacterium]
MKKFLYLISLLLCLTCVLSLLVACTEPDADDTPAPDDSQQETPPAEVMVDIIADGATAYRIIRGELYTTADAVTQAAIHLRQAIIDTTGVEIGINTDYEEYSADIPEIVVGKTTRAVGTNLDLALEDNQFWVYFDGKDILLTGNTEYAVENAVDYFITTYLTGATVTIPQKLDYVGSFALPPDVYVIGDIRNTTGKGNNEDWNDMIRLIASMQGRLNKVAKENGYFVYLIDNNGATYVNNDYFWLDYISGEGKLLEGSRRIELNSWQQLWDALGSHITASGIVVWDPNAPATANVAATICSVEGYLPVRYDTGEDSLYTWLTSNGVEVKLSLVDMFTGELGTKIADTDIDSTGSIKCDPYLWAMEKYMDRCSATMLAYALDGASQVESNYIYQQAEGTSPAYNQLYSHDYYIYNECFFIDLTCIADEKPCDDPDQPMGTDAKTLAAILSTMEERNNGQFSKLMGFPPWYMKYTRFHNLGKTAEVTLEWTFVAFITEYNFIKEADAAHPSWMTNASVYCQYEMTTEKFENNESPLEEIYDDRTRYFSIYIGDYDSSAWLKLMAPDCFESSQLGQIPLMWAFNPNLSDRVPMIFDYVYEKKTELDYFTTGDTGAGYVFPSRLKDLNMWVEYNEPYLEKFDMDIVGFIIDDRALSLEILQTYARITPYGAFTNVGTYASEYLTVLDDQTVFLREWDIYPYQGEACFKEMYNQFTRYGTYNFAGYRCIRQYTPDIVKAVNDFLAYAEAQPNDRYDYMYVDTYTLFDLILQSEQGAWVYSE